MNLHLVMDGDRDRDPYWNTGLSSQAQMKSRRRENMSKEVRTTRVGPPTETVCLIKWELTKPAGLGLNEHVIKLDSLNVADNED